MLWVPGWVPSGHTKDYQIGIWCFSAEHAALMRKSKDWLSPNQDNVSEWSYMSTRSLLFQWASTIRNQPSKADIIIVSSNVTCFCHDIAEKLRYQFCVKQHTLTQLTVLVNILYELLACWTVRKYIFSKTSFKKSSMKLPIQFEPTLAGIVLKRFPF